MNKKITYSVILSISLDTPFGELLEEFCSKITSIRDSKNYLFHFWCSEVDASHPVYLEIVSHRLTTVQELDSEDPGPGLRWRIPHQFVLLIADPPLDREHLGF